jgi:putative FmdB family regulatory protein
MPFYDYRCKDCGETFEVRATRKRADAHETDHRACGKPPANPREDLNEIQLVEEIVFEPQDDFVLAPGAEQPGASAARYVAAWAAATMRP